MDYVEQIEKMRLEKNNFFREHPQSPLTPKIRSDFRGLKYYPVDKAFVFVGSIEKPTEKIQLQIPSSGGEIKIYEVFGTFKFKVNEQEVQIQVYNTPGDSYLFVPFRDSTSGKETYGAGRYLEIHKVDDRNEYVFDFNTAYNPFCAYNENYTCPLPPRANWLRVAITSGEKTLH